MNIMGLEMAVVPCKWCGEDTTYLGTRECNLCHETRRGIQIIADHVLVKMILRERHIVASLLRAGDTQ